MNGHFLDERNFKNYISNDTSASQSKEYFILQMMGNTDTVKEIIGQCLYSDKDYVLSRRVGYVHVYT